MASTRRWRRVRQSRYAEALNRRISEQLDAGRCQVMDEAGIRCPNKAYSLGYCTHHWGR